ncbi:hypothetical protein RB620_02265 [Paenibacillus sp. LHD-117]|uniref:YphA family membrane protein n=1 Tax=Paenibacillus sp. LHD-117 TaxID=3071412 RepID=UPI0027E1621E|nr:hypothetical protein [Paenibacillus sp. LHD-117]MDQ6418253.1 hypothetical protein [Paenibacillus sp. LHD-117]
MIPGYLSVWLALVITILFATGWKPYIAPKLRSATAVVMTCAMAAAALYRFWWMPFPRYPFVNLHGAVLVLLAASLIALAFKDNKGHRGYLVLCIFMLAIIWGSIRSLYTHDPVLYWLEPCWDAPLLCGLLCCIFTMNIRYQAGALLWCAVFGDAISAWLENGAYTALIGSLNWWDSYSLALSAACCSTLAIRCVRYAGAIVGRTWVGIRGGRE